MHRRGIFVFGIMGLLGELLLTGGAQSVAAQADGFRLVMIAATCQNLPTSGPFVGGGCVPAELYIEVTTPDGDLLGSCTTSGAADARWGGCGFTVPYGSAVVVTADESMIPDGFALWSPNPQMFTIPDRAPDGEDGGPVFISLPIAQDDGSTDPSGGGAVSDLPATGSGIGGSQQAGHDDVLIVARLAAGALGAAGLVVRRRSHVEFPSRPLLAVRDWRHGRS